MASSLNSRLLFKREYQEPSQSPYLIKAVEGHYPLSVSAPFELHIIGQRAF